VPDLVEEGAQVRRRDESGGQQLLVEPPGHSQLYPTDDLCWVHRGDGEALHFGLVLLVFGDELVEFGDEGVARASEQRVEEDPVAAQVEAGLHDAARQPYPVDSAHRQDVRELGGGPVHLTVLEQAVPQQAWRVDLMKRNDYATMTLAQVESY
jgi:hypothetical protein